MWSTIIKNLTSPIGINIMEKKTLEKIKKLELKRDKIDKEIRSINREVSLKTTYKGVKHYVGNYYKFRNSYSGSYESWYIYGFCKGRILEDSTVYLIFDEYENNLVSKEVFIKLNQKHLMNDSWDRGWRSIKKEEFEKEKEKIIKFIN
jgi:hypothetical protein